VPRYGKLIRDLIPEELDGLGIGYHVKTLDQAAYEDALREKLEEELKEFRTAPREKQLEELADLQEVVKALAETLGGEEALEEVRAAKAERRGGFRKRLWLVETSD
jgi:predicted house-cleaning noncanonical NTP pyrophosphatase (MazG superfamily)